MFHNLRTSIRNVLRPVRSLVRQESYALDELDRKLKPYLNFRYGFFVEAGANDGRKFSNTLYFEKYKRWRGLLIEPIAELAEQCRRNRPACIVENCALVPFDFEGNSVEMRYCGLMSLVSGAMKSHEQEDAHVAAGSELQGIDSYRVDVPARTLTSVLDAHQIERVDFLSLDVEGYELDVLKGLDLEKHHPSWMLIEARYRDEIDAYLQALYEPVAELTHHDVLYRWKKGA